jgi:hypothetical protein
MEAATLVYLVCAGWMYSYMHVSIQIDIYATFHTHIRTQESERTGPYTQMYRCNALNIITLLASYRVVAYLV